MLAAVFSMHGLQCVAAGPTVAHADTGPMSDSSMTAGVHMVTSPALSPVASATHAGAGHASPAAESVDSSAAGTGSSSHASAHALAVCLAVLLVGLAVLGGALVVRRVSPSALAGPALARLRRASAISSDALRPPELSDLCLLRI